MNYRNLRIGLGLIAIMSSLAVQGSAQQASTGGTSTATGTGSPIVPQLVNYSGVLTDTNGKPLTNLVGVTFTLYQESEGGTPLWMEIQNVQPTKSGHYSVMLGSTTSAGLPQDVFANGEARWLGVQAEGQAEQPRVMLLSVPYALKAADAETVGTSALGLHASCAAGGDERCINLKHSRGSCDGIGSSGRQCNWNRDREFRSAVDHHVEHRQLGVVSIWKRQHGEDRH